MLQCIRELGVFTNTPNINGVLIRVPYILWVVYYNSNSYKLIDILLI